MMHPVFRPTLADAIIARYTGAQPALPDPAEHVLRQEENADSAASYGTYLENIRSLTQCITENMIVNLRFDFSFVNRLLGGALHAPGAAGAAGRGMPVPPAAPSALGSAPHTAAVQKAETIPAVLTPQGMTPQGTAKTGAAALTEPARGAAKGERPAAAERPAAEIESGADGRAPAQRAKAKSKKARQAPDRTEGKAASAARTAQAAAQAELIYAVPGGVPAQPGEGAAMAAQPVPAKAFRRAPAVPDALQPAGAAHQDVGVRPAASPAAAAPAPAGSTRTARAAAAEAAVKAAAAGPAPAPRPKRADAPNGRAGKQAALSAGAPIGGLGLAADGTAEELRPFPSFAAAPERAENGEAGNSTVKRRAAPAPAELLLPHTAAPESTAREGRAAGEEKESAAAHIRPAQAETVQTMVRVPRGEKDAVPQAAAAQQPAGRRQSAAAPGRGAAQGIPAAQGRGIVPGIPAPPWKPSPAVLTKEAAPTSPADAAARVFEAAHAPRAGAELVLADAAALPAQQTRTPRAARHFAGAPQPAAEDGAGSAARPVPAEHESFPKAPAGMPAPWKAAENHAGTAPAAPAYPLAETVHAAADTQPAAGAAARQEYETVQGTKAQGAMRPAAAKNEAAARASDFAPAEQTLRRPPKDRAAGRAAGEAQPGSAEARAPRLPRAPQAAQTGKTPKAGAKTAAAQEMEMPAAVRRQEAFLARLAAQPAAKRARTAPAQIVPAAQDAAPYPAQRESAAPLATANAAGAAHVFPPAAPQAERAGTAAQQAADAADAFSPDRAHPAAQTAPAAHFSGAELLYRSEAAQDASAPAAVHAPENDIETIRTVRRETQRTVNAAVHREVHAAPPQTTEYADPAAVTELAEKVYRRIEQRLKNEKWRRGL